MSAIFFNSLFLSPTGAPAIAEKKDMVAIEAPCPSDSPSFIADVKQIGAECLDVLKDDKWMALFSNLFAIASLICALMGGQATSYLPWLAICSAPVYLYHTLQDTIERGQLVVAATKTSRAADAFFWAGKGAGSVGSALSDLIKPFAGCMALFGLANLAAVNLTFSYIFPVILIILSVVGSGSQGWGLSRSVKAWDKFEKRKEKIDGSLESLELFLSTFYNPSQQDTALKALKAKNISENYFTSPLRMGLVQNRIKHLFEYENKMVMNEAQKAISQIIPLIEEEQKLHVENYANLTPLQRLAKTITFCDNILAIAVQLEAKEPTFSGAMKQFMRFISTLGTNEPSFKELVKNLQIRRQELCDLKAKLYREGADIVNTIESEVEHKTLELYINIIAGIVMLIAAILILCFPEHKLAANILSLSSSIVAVGNLLFNRYIPYTNFLSKNLETQAPSLDTN